MLDGLGTAFEIMANTYKPFACAIVTHAVIDGCLRLRGQHRFRPEQITQVLLTVAPVALALAGNPHPRTGLESKFSLHHAAALALTNGRVSHHDFADATAADAGLASLRATVTARTDTGFAKDQAVVTLHLDDGRILMQAVEHALGGIGHPMSDADLDAKFHDLVDAPLGRAGADALLASCWGVEALEDVTELAAAAVPRPDVAA